jgi:hypothetical protein
MDRGRDKLSATTSQGGEAGRGLEGLASALPKPARRGRPPIHLWNPDFCGDIDMRIAADGTWFYNGTPIGRLPLVKLFASILRREAERYVLVTPVEKVGIRVEDAPFQAVAMDVRDAGRDRVLALRTNVDDEAEAGPANPLRFERDPAGGVKPYVLVRDALWARLTRPLLYDLVELGEEQAMGGTAWFGVRSGGVFFPIAPAAELDVIT